MVVLPIMFGGCGTVSPVQQGATTAPPSADFSLTISTSALTLDQGGLSAPVSLTVTPNNGFGASVQVTLTGLPAGVTSNPASPFNVMPGTAPRLFLGLPPMP
jgi:hypothetical protein